MEMAFASGPHNGLGVRLDIACDPVLLYSETPGYLLEVGPDDLPALAGLAAPVRVIGEVVPAFSISGNGWELNLRELCEQWRDEAPAALVDPGEDPERAAARIEKLMLESAARLEFEEAARLRDELRKVLREIPGASGHRG